jgi:pimeloyl-ACP methyl ester carboxylesterase
MVNVPLDHANPGRAAIQIALVRLPAAGPGARIGSLFVNPGGPGGSGVDFVLGAGPVLYTDELRARFDIVGFDPRGVARSTPLRCFGTDRQWWFAPFNFPMTAPEEEYWRATDLYLIDRCDQRATRILDHMSTADVARDLDLLRIAVGDDKLTYAGYSYGSYLGVTYANLFPERVRALVVDGVLDPVAWATGTGDGDTVPFTTRLRSDAGAQQTLEEFFRLCDAGGTQCAFSPNASDRFAALADYFRAGNQVIVTLPSGVQRLFTYDRLIGRTLSSMYDPYSWPLLANVLLRIEEAMLAASAPAATAAAGAALQAFWEDIGLVTKRGVPRYQNFAESFSGVGCADSDNPGDWRVWGPAGAAADAQYGYFGRIWTWSSSQCADWPASQASRYAGPFTAETIFPVLVATTRNDPATRYEGAAAVHGLLPRSRLLTVDGWGHCSFFFSAAADQAVSDYLVHRRLPDDGVVFQPDYVPFQAAGAAAATPSSTPGAKVTGREKRRMVTGALVPDFVRIDAQ